MLAPQRDALIAAGVELNRIYEDLASGRKDHRPGLNARLKALQPGNTLVIWKLDRPGRDLKYLVATVDALRSRNIGLKVLALARVPKSIPQQQMDDWSLEFLRHWRNSSGN